MNILDVAPAIFVPMIVFSFIAVIIIVPMWLKSMERARMHETLRRLHQDGQEITPQMLEALRPSDSLLRESHSPMADLHRGFILIAVALALIVLGLIVDAGDRSYRPVWALIGIAAFPGFIGVASLIMWRIKTKAGAEA